MVKKKNAVEIVSLAELLSDNEDVKAMREEERLNELELTKTEVLVVPDETAVLIVEAPVEPVVVVKPVKKAKVSVSVEQSDAYPVEVRFTFTNDTTKPVYLLVPRLGLDSFDGAYVKVDSDAPYLGEVVKKSPYTIDGVVQLAPSASISSAWVRLDSLYSLGDSEVVRVKYSATHPLTGKLTYLTAVTSEWCDVTVHAEIIEEEVEPTVDEIPVEEPQYTQDETFKVQPVAEEHGYRSYWKNKAHELSDKLSKAADKNLWLMLSVLSTGIAAAGTIIWAIPIALFSVLGVILGVISLKKKEEPKDYAILSVIVSSVMFLVSTSFYLIIIILAYIALLILGA